METNDFTTAREPLELPTKRPCGELHAMNYSQLADIFCEEDFICIKLPMFVFLKAMRMMQTRCFRKFLRLSVMFCRALLLSMYSVACPTSWNSLPDRLRDPTPSSGSFRKLFQTKLFASY